MEVARGSRAALTKRFSRPVIRRIFLALSSAALLVFSFPNFNQPWCAWVALVPWLLLLADLKLREAFWWSCLVGALFFLGSIWWLVYVTVFGWVLLCAYLALFFGLFGLAAHWAHTFNAKRSALNSVIFLPAVWVVLEHARTHLLSGFGWNLLAYSQTPWPMVIQIARVTGAWGVSFMVVLANTAIFQAIRSQSWRKLLVPACVVLGTLLYAAATMVPKAPVVSRVAVVQGNIPQDRKWDENYAEEILSRYERLTRQAAQAKPDLIIWPETSAPGYLGVDEELTQRIFRLAKEVKQPLLIGSPVPKLSGGSFVFLNRANLVDGDAIVATYDKLHLVPYGEFIPGDRQFPWLRKMLPPIGDFVPGTDHTVFKLDSGLKFSVLICFEDVFPELARDFVRRGAQALVVITNDAWFGPTAAAYQHAQTSAFRAVELGVSVIRAANTGWSGWIDPWGVWHDPVKDAAGRELFVEGFSLCAVNPALGRTFYARWGDWFAWICLAVALLTVLPGIITFLYPRRNERGTQRPNRKPAR